VIHSPRRAVGKTEASMTENRAPWAIESNALGQQPLSKFSDRELLRVMRSHVKFYPSRRFYREICKRGLWRTAFAQPVHVDHITCFIEVVEQAPYHNQSVLNRECQSVVEAGVIDYLKRTLQAIADLRLKFGTITVFQRDPGVRIPRSIMVPDELITPKVPGRLFFGE
jgi:hypothetical protein